VHSPGYPNAAEIKRAIQAVRKDGLRVGLIQVRPDGTISISQEPVAVAVDEFSVWESRS
jgi:hypothetical protein